MDDFSRVFYLNGRQLLYTRRIKNSNTIEKKITEIPQGKDFVAGVSSFPIVTVKSERNGASYSYDNKFTFQAMNAERNSTGAYTVTVPTQKGKIYVGYIKDCQPISWTRHKETKKLMKKMANIIKKGI